MTSAVDRVGAQAAPTLGIVSGATMLVLIIFTVPLTTLEPTARALGAGPGAQAWFLSAMPLGAATGLLTAGALGDNHGRRMVFLWGLTVMAAASALGALAISDLMLIIARVAQGLGGAAVMACGLGLLGQAFPDGVARTRATAAWAAALGAGIAIGPIFAAFAAAIGGWTAPYWGTGLLTAALLLAGSAALPETETSRNRNVDWLGATLLMTGLAMIMSGLTEIRLGWAHPSVLILLCGGFAILSGFLYVEARHRDPMLDLSLFRSADFVGATVAAFASGAGVIALMTLVPSLLSRAMQFEALAAAFVLCAWSVTSVVTALAARFLGSAIGITLGTVLMAHGAEAGGLSELLDGWNEAVLITAGFSLLGAITVAIARD